MKMAVWKQEDWEDLYRTIESFKERVAQRSLGNTVVTENELALSLQISERRRVFIEKRLADAMGLLVHNCEPSYPEWDSRRVAFLSELDPGMEQKEPVI